MAVTRPKKSVSIRRDQEDFLNRIAPAGSRLSSSCIQSALDLLMEASDRYGRPFNANMLAGFTDDYLIISKAEIEQLRKDAENQ